MKLMANKQTIAFLLFEYTGKSFSFYFLSHSLSPLLFWLFSWICFIFCVLKVLRLAWNEWNILSTSTSRGVEYFYWPWLRLLLLTLSVCLSGKSGSNSRFWSALWTIRRNINSHPIQTEVQYTAELLSVWSATQCGGQ